MDYLRLKYKGYKEVATSNLQMELLLNDSQYMMIRREVMTALEVKRCPDEIGYDLFDSLIELHL